MTATIYTLGHSTHTTTKLLELIRSAGEDATVVDVRSWPYSGHNPQFDRDTLKAAVTAAGLRYRWDPRLGGRPHRDDLYDPDGHVRYDLVAGTAIYQEALETLLAEATRRPVVVLCSEEDPAGCHRHLLVGRTVKAQGYRIVHVRGDGTHEDDPGGQMSLFDDPPPWRSVRPVR